MEIKGKKNQRERAKEIFPQDNFIMNEPEK